MRIGGELRKFSLQLLRSQTSRLLSQHALTVLVCCAKRDFVRAGRSADCREGNPQSGVVLEISIRGRGRTRIWIRGRPALLGESTGKKSPVLTRNGHKLLPQFSRLAMTFSGVGRAWTHRNQGGSPSELDCTRSLAWRVGSGVRSAKNI